MTSRERVLAALEYQPPDRVPIDINPTLSFYRSLFSHLRIRDTAISAPNSAMEVIPNPEILTGLGIDCISVKLGENKVFKDELPRFTTDEWGVKRKLVHQSAGEYYEVVYNPLAGASIDDLDDFSWPEARPESKAEPLMNNAAKLFKDSELALVGRFGPSIFETAIYLLGIEEWFVRLLIDQEFTKKLLEKISDICTQRDILGIEAAGEYIQIMKVSGEDLGMQQGPLYSMETFFGMILPPMKKRWQTVSAKLKEVNSKAKIMLHSCGAISNFIPYLIEAGIEVLDPLQPLAHDMNAASLYRRFGGELVFHGGIDIQELLPKASPERVAEKTKEVLEAFHADDGGYIASPSHAIQADVPPENILAMIDTVKSRPPRKIPKLR